MTRSSGGGHYGAWRALTAAPAMVGSVLLLGVLLGWLGAGLLLLTRRGERLAVRAWCGFRRPSRVEQEALRPVWRAVLARCGIAPGQVELNVQRSPGPNAYAAGRRSVAVTTGVLQIFLARRISDEDMEAVLVHELGHHATRGSRFGLVTVWLAAPWRLAALLVLGVAAAFGGRRQPLWLLAPIVAAAVGIAIAQAAAQGQWSTVAILGTLVAVGIGSPLSDAAVSRASERAADRYASATGVGLPLARALRAMNPGRPRRVGMLRRLLARHPPAEVRIDALLAAEVVRSATGDGQLGEHAVPEQEGIPAEEHRCVANDAQKTEQPGQRVQVHTNAALTPPRRLDGRARTSSRVASSGDELGGS